MLAAVIYYGMVSEDLDCDLFVSAVQAITGVKTFHLNVAGRLSMIERLGIKILPAVVVFENDKPVACKLGRLDFQNIVKFVSHIRAARIPT